MMINLVILPPSTAFDNYINIDLEVTNSTS